MECHFDKMKFFKRLNSFLFFLCLEPIAAVLRLTSSRNSSRSVTLLIYGLRVPFLLQAIPFTSAGFDVGISHINRQYSNSLSFRSVYADNSAVVVCPDVGAYFDSVSEFYYRHRNPNDTTVLLYAGCDANPIFANLGREWDILVISTGMTFSNLRDRTRYPATIALGPFQYEIYGIITRLVLEKYKWRSIAFVYDVSGRMPFNLLVYQRILLHLRTNMPHVQVTPFQVNVSDTNGASYSSIIRQATSATRIIFISAPPPVTRSLVIHAELAGWAVGQLVWIAVDPGLGLKSTVLWEENDVEDEVALRGLQSVLKIQPCVLNPNTSGTRSLIREFNRYTKIHHNVTVASEEPNDFVSTAYATVLWLAQVFNGTISDEDLSGCSLARRFLNQSFATPLIGDLYVDEMGERQNQMCLMTFDSSSRSFENTMYYFQGYSKELLPFNSRHIEWVTFDGQPPSDRPVCPGKLSGQQPYCSSKRSGDVVSIAVPVTVLFAMFVFAIFMFHSRKSTERWDPDWWNLKLQVPSYMFRN